MEQELLIQLQEIKQLLLLQKEILTLEEFCQYAGISKNQAYHLTSSGKVKFYRPFGKLIYFDLSEIIDFLKQNPVLDIKERERGIHKSFLNNKK
jgi:excisionase family DNA binding protein